MNWILKNKKTPGGIAPSEYFTERKNISQEKNVKTHLVVLFLICLFVLFSSSKAMAADKASCTFPSVQTPMAQVFIGDTVDGTIVTKENCCDLAYKYKFPRTAGTPCNFKDVGGTGAVNGGPGGTADPKTQNVEKATSIGGLFTDAIRSILTQVQALVGWLFAIAATLFAWVVEPANISGDTGMLNKTAVKDVWIMVRDLLNMTFILVLLFAAFCTIFQVDKWNLKKVWLNILINALLVNFSYPIARFFIDVSNVAFYYFVNHLFSATGTIAVTGNGIFAMFSSASNVGSLLAPAGFSDSPIAYQIAMIVVTFIMGMTLLILAGLFVVRLVALTMLVMFSPIGFVGYIFPSTSEYADKWWKQLFSYSFFAPIMIFIMSIALHISEALKAENIQSMISNSSANAPASQIKWISDLAFYFIPVIILWVGMGVAKNSGIAGADKVVDNVKKGGKWLANRPGALGGYAWKRSGVPGGIKKGYENATKSGKLFGSTKLGWILKNGQEGRENKVTGFVDDRMKGVNKAVEKKKAEEFRKKAKEKAEEHDDKSGMELANKIYAAQLSGKDAEKNAMDVAAMLHHLKSDSSKKDEYDAHLMSTILSDPIHMSNTSDMDSSQKDAYVKTAMSEHWKALNKKAKQAHNVAVKKELPGDDEVKSEPKAKAKANTNINTSNTFANGAGI